jgi:hypothetical protein
LEREKCFKVLDESYEHFIHFLAYFPKMKVGLSNHQSVCMYVCPPLITSELIVNFYEMWYRDNSIQGYLDAIIIIPIASITLKLLRFRFVR